VGIFLRQLFWTTYLYSPKMLFSNATPFQGSLFLLVPGRGTTTLPASDPSPLFLYLPQIASDTCVLSAAPTLDPRFESHFVTRYCVVGAFHVTNKPAFFLVAESNTRQYLPLVLGPVRWAVTMIHRLAPSMHTEGSTVSPRPLVPISCMIQVNLRKNALELPVAARLCASLCGL